MQANDRDAALSPEEEFRRLREKTGREELAELKRGLMGGYRRRDVAIYVARLKNQLQTAERTFKNHIAELSAEKDQLRYERDTLQARLDRQDAAASSALDTELEQARRVAEGFLADRGALEEKLKDMARESDDAIAELQNRADALEAELSQAREREAMLLREREEMLNRDREVDLQDRDDTAPAVDQSFLRMELESLQAENEGLQVRLEAMAARAEQVDAEHLRALRDMGSGTAAEQARTAEADARLEEAARQLNSLAAENASLTSRLEAAGKSIENLLEDKDAVDAINARLRRALNSLLVRAEAVIKENGVVSSLLETEREKVQQYQAAHGRLADMLARVRMAGQMLDERVADLDKALSRGDPAPGRAAPAAQARVRAELQESANARCNNPLNDVITELNAIQSILAQYQQPPVPADGPDEFVPGTPDRFRDIPADGEDESVS